MTEERQKWLGITYTAPAKPSKARVYIWRKLKELGAEYYHGMAMIPQSPKTLDSVKKLAARMRELGAEVSVLEIRFVDLQDEEKVVSQFKRQAENDFRELFLDFARLYEELGEPLDGEEDQGRMLRRRYGKVRSRDFFPCGGGAQRVRGAGAAGRGAPGRGPGEAGGGYSGLYRGAVPAVCGAVRGKAPGRPAAAGGTAPPPLTR